MNPPFFKKNALEPNQEVKKSYEEYWWDTLYYSCPEASLSSCIQATVAQVKVCPDVVCENVRYSIQGGEVLVKVGGKYVSVDSVAYQTVQTTLDSQTVQHIRETVCSAGYVTVMSGRLDFLGKTLETIIVRNFCVWLLVRMRG